MKRISSWGNLFPSCFHLTMKRYSHFDYMGILSFSYFFPFFLYFLYNPPIHCCTSNPSKCHMPSKWCSTWENRRRGSVVAFSGAISPTAGHRQFSPATTTDLPPVASLRWLRCRYPATCSAAGRVRTVDESIYCYWNTRTTKWKRFVVYEETYHQPAKTKLPCPTSLLRPVEVVFWEKSDYYVR